MNFREFKMSEPAISMFRRMGILPYLAAADSWRALRSLIVDWNDNQERGAFVEIARQCDGVCSSGERILLHAILYVTDFAWVSDKLDKERELGTWQEFNRVSGEHKRCVAACIAAEVY